MQNAQSSVGGRSIYLTTLQHIADGTDSLAEVERQNPIIGAQLRDFVVRLNNDCRTAYERLSACLDSVLTLSKDSSKEERKAAIETLNTAGEKGWFSLAGICDDLGALAGTYGDDIERHANAVSSSAPEQSRTLRALLVILHQQEGEVKNEIREAVDMLKIMISDGEIERARTEALQLKREIERYLTRINGIVAQIVGSGARGASEILKSQIAAQALRRPERTMILNMAFVLVILAFGTVVLLKISLVAFFALATFILATVVVLNAIYLRSINELDQEKFVELLKLALLNFFAPLARRSA
jgi:hypothetical protein